MGYEYSRFLSAHGGELSPENVMAIVIEKTGWTFQEYESQPVWIIRLLMQKWSLEAEHHNRENEKKKN